MLRVKHLLTGKESGTQVWTIQAEEPVLEAIRIMADKGIGAMPVLRGTALVGIVSERDYARKVILQGKTSAHTAVAEIMTHHVITVRAEDTVHHCMQLMTEKRIRHLPVLEHDQLIGMISIGDLVKAVIDEQQETIVQLERYIAG